MVAPVSGGPQQVGEAVAAIGAASGVMVWLKPWKGVMAIGRLFGHEKRLRELERGMATKADLDALSEAMSNHESRDAESFRKLDEKMDHALDTMARRDDVKDLERNLSALLIKGFPTRR